MRGEVCRAVGNTLVIAFVAAALFGVAFGVLLRRSLAAYPSATAGSTRSSPRRRSSAVSIPHYWLGLVLVDRVLGPARLVPGDGRGAGRLGHWRSDTEHLRY